MPLEGRRKKELKNGDLGTFHLQRRFTILAGGDLVETEVVGLKVQKAKTTTWLECMQINLSCDMSMIGDRVLKGQAPQR